MTDAEREAIHAAIDALPPMTIPRSTRQPHAQAISNMR